jgi:hypothetical protein
VVSRIHERGVLAFAFPAGLGSSLGDAIRRRRKALGRDIPAGGAHGTPHHVHFEGDDVGARPREPMSGSGAFHICSRNDYAAYALAMSSFSNTPSSVFMEDGLLTNGASGLAPFTGSNPL